MAVQDRQDLYRRLAEIARTQSGYFTAAQALEAGYSYQAQRYHVQRNNWVRIERGVFRFPEWPRSEHEELVRWTLWSGGRAVLSHESALAFHELGDFMPARVHLTVPSGFARRTTPVVLHMAELDPGEVEEKDGFKVTTPVRSLLDVADAGADLDQLARAISDALERGATTKRSLRAAADIHGTRAALAVERALGEIAE